MSYTHIPIIGLTGPAGCGKDTVAAFLRDHAGYRIRAFADALRDEVCDAFNVPPSLLTHRDTKETPSELLALRYCTHMPFVNAMALLVDAEAAPSDEGEFYAKPRSPREIMQAWGTDYRRKFCGSDFWTHQWWPNEPKRPEIIISAVAPDVRFSNEADFIREHGGQVWKITRPGTSLINSHASETTGDAFNPERTIYNDRGLLELRTETLRNLWEATSGLCITTFGNAMEPTE